MEFIETPVFWKDSVALLGDEGIRNLQTVLMFYPERGAVIPGSRGLRKIRWVSSGKGKRGGLRIIYYFVTEDQRIFLLYVYEKSKQDDLTREQLRCLRSLLEEEYHV